MCFVMWKEISHASTEGASHSILFIHSTALFYPEPTESSEAFSFEENLTGTIDKGEALPHISGFNECHSLIYI